MKNACLLAVLCALVIFCGHQALAADRPNLIWIMAGYSRAFETGFCGCTLEWMVFTDERVEREFRWVGQNGF